MLERALSGLTSPIVLCQQTDDVATAREWLRTLTAGGIEGLVIKDAAGTYPTQAGQRVWWKVKAKTTLDMLAVGFTGTSTRPSALVLAFPGVVDEAGQPVTAGSTTVLTTAAAKSLTSLLRPTGETIERTFAWGSSEPTTVTLIEPFVVEVEADASAETECYVMPRVSTGLARIWTQPRRHEVCQSPHRLERCGRQPLLHDHPGGL